MRYSIFLVIFFVFIISCKNNLIPDNSEISNPVPGILYYELNDSVQFTNAALMITDTLNLEIYIGKGINYKIITDANDTSDAKRILDSILQSKIYISKQYTIINYIHSASSENLKFINFDIKATFDWIETVDSFNLIQVINIRDVPHGYIKVPKDQEQVYINRLAQHPWYIRKVSYVYGTINEAL